MSDDSPNTKERVINRERFDSVRQKYGYYASWAVWGAKGLTPKSGMGDISFFEHPRQELLATLNPEVILVYNLCIKWKK